MKDDNSYTKFKKYAESIVVEPQSPLKHPLDTSYVIQSPLLKRSTTACSAGRKQNKASNMARFNNDARKIIK